MSSVLPKIVVILGPTASGKTGLGLELAKECNGEVISADSRQVYTGMAIGTAQPRGIWKTVHGKRRYMVDGIPHYLVDIMPPDAEMSAAEFKDKALELIYDICRRGKVPFVVGGTGLYLWSLIDNLTIPEVSPNVLLRSSLEGYTTDELTQKLAQLDPEAPAQIDCHNPRRLIRAIEIVTETKRPLAEQRRQGPALVEALQIGISWSTKELQVRIDARVDEQIQQGLEAETKELLCAGYQGNLPSMSGIGYPEMIQFIQGEMTLAEAVDKIKIATHQYAKRQMTWFKRDERIQWINGPDIKKAKTLVSAFLD